VTPDGADSPSGNLPERSPQTLTAGLGETRFTGYDAEQAHSEVVGLVVNGARATTARTGDRVEVFTAVTPFFAESSGQVGDTGTMVGPGGLVTVEDAQHPVACLVSHLGRVERGEIHVGDRVELAVDGARRDLVRANHSATHLLQLALRETLGEHATQAGSVVAPGHLRFDFAHFKPLTLTELHALEARVNALVRDNIAGITEVLPLEEARKSGALMCSGAAYGQTVRMVTLGPSQELCGGIHVRRTGDIAFFKVVSEESIAAGVRRIVAVTGDAALQLAQRTEEELRRAAGLLRTGAFEVATQIELVLRRSKELEGELEEAGGQLAAARSGDLAAQARDVRGVKVLAVQVQGGARVLRDLADRLRERLGSGVVALGTEADGKAVLLVAVTKDLTGKLKAGDLVREAARLVGGSGGGKPELAQAGGSEPSGLAAALEKVQELVAAALG